MMHAPVALCRRCASSKVAEEPRYGETVKYSDEMLQRLERHVLVSSVLCQNCERVHADLECQTRAEEQQGLKLFPSDLGINTRDDFDSWMASSVQHLLQHEDEVLKALHVLSDIWPTACQSVADLFRMRVEGSEDNDDLPG
jgi:hypothetical protein